jgi:hypothetical protein
MTEPVFLCSTTACREWKVSNYRKKIGAYSISYPNQQFHCSPCQANIFGMMLDKDIHDIPIKVYPFRDMLETPSQL